MPAQVISLQKYKDDRATKNSAVLLTIFFPFVMWTVVWTLFWR